MENDNKYDVDKLKYYYFEKKLSIVEIAKLCSTPYPKMYHILKKSFPNIEYRKVKRGRLRQNLTREELIELHYEKRLSLLEIAKIYGTTYRSVHLYMKELNLPTNKDVIRTYASGYKIKKIDLPKEKLYELYYEQKLSLQKIGELYGKDRTYIYRWMRKYGFKTRAKTEAWKHRGSDELYEINEKYFDSWTNKMAYVLGIIVTDGNIASDSGKISMSMKEGDHLEKIRKMIGTEHPVKYQEQIDLFTLGFTRKNMTDSLFKLGITSKKSFKVKFPIVPDKNLPHFIRGVFDGDGSVFFEARSKTYPLRVSFTSASKSFMTTLEEKLNLHAGLSKRTIYETHRRNIEYYIRYCHKDCLKFFDYIYAGADESMWLERKHQKFLEGMCSGVVT